MTGPIEPMSDDELTRRLEAFVERRLSPDAATSDRMRAAVLAEAGRPRPRTVVARPPERATARRRWLAVSLAAALTAVFAFGAVASAAPGSPLYQVRLWAEGVILPSGGDARSEAILDQLTSRIDEAEAAAARGDQNAVAEALAAYRAEVEAALASAGDDADRLARLQAALGKHLAVLHALTEMVPEQARDAIEGAIDSSSKAVDRIDASGGPKPSRGPDASHGPPSDPPGASGGGQP